MHVKMCICGTNAHIMPMRDLYYMLNNNLLTQWIQKMR